ncbi:MAG TPA: hypothetical protein VGD67_14335 [Pseudonocardiaceae bacterium]
MPITVRRALRGGVAAITLLLAAGPVAAAAEAAQAPDVRVSVSWDDREYLVGEEVPIEVTIANHGGAAEQVGGATMGAGLVVPPEPWGPYQGFGATLGAGETVVVDLRVQTDGAAPGSTVDLIISVFAALDPLHDNTVTVPIRFVGGDVVGDVDGVVYADRNGDGAYGPGEGLPNVRVSLTPSALVTHTDSGGRFVFEDVPARRYTLVFDEVPGAWYPPDPVTVDVTGEPMAQVHALARPLPGRGLAASLRFDADRYRPGGTVTMTLELSAAGEDLVDLRAVCPAIEGVPTVVPGAGWAELTGPGIDLAAGTTRRLALTGTVPTVTAHDGWVQLECFFSAAGDSVPLVSADDHAAVLGGLTSDVRGLVFHDRNGNLLRDAGEEVVPNTGLGLYDIYSGALVVKVRVGPDGRFLARGIPNGRYQARVYGPWAFAGIEAGRVFAGSCVECGGDQLLGVVPGPVVPEDPGPYQPPPQGSPPPGGGLADTGASVVALGVSGLLLVALGGTAVVLARRSSRRGVAGGHGPSPE